MKNHEKNEKYVDLHLHTTYSDGSTSPEQVVKDCALMGVGTIAITDHDNIDGYYRAKTEADKWGLELITGVEITSNRYHILGYDFDINNKEFQEFIKQNRELNNKRTYTLIDNLNENGIPITREKVDKYFAGGMLNKIHVSMAMVLDEECKNKIKTTDISEIMYKYMHKTSEYRKNIPKEYPSDEKIIYEIQKAGGVAIIAHPPKDVKNIREIDELLKAGINGIELQPRFGELNKPYEEYAKRNNMIVTYGSDFHGARYTSRPLLGRENNNQLIPFWKEEKEGNNYFKNENKEECQRVTSQAYNSFLKT